MNNIHTITIDVETISIQTGDIFHKIPICGIKNGNIINEDEFEKCLGGLIIKHEKSLSYQIEEVSIVCNIFNVDIVKIPQNEKYIPTDGFIFCNKIAFESVILYEVFPEEQLNKLFQITLNLGLNTGGFWSAMGLFVLNFSKVMRFNDTRLLFFGAKNTTLCFIDASLKVVELQKIEKGIVDIIEYITYVTMTKFPYIKKQSVAVILQHFVCFNELEMIEKIQNSKHLSGDVMSLIQYDVVSYVVLMLRRYFEKIFQDTHIGSNVYIHCQREYATSFMKVLKLLKGANCLPLSGDAIAIPIRNKTKHNIVDDIFRLFFSK